MAPGPALAGPLLEERCVTAIDEYLANVEPAKREALERIRRLAKKAVPDADEAISYGMPTLKYRGKPFLGFDAHAHHIGIYPFSGQVIESLKDQLRDYATTKGAIRIPLAMPIPERTLRAVIDCRLRGIRADQR
jgi:uncharacterized protein YdhG (YjbR/CyaY superfamily)